jgi:hypothetical protein
VAPSPLSVAISTGKNDRNTASARVEAEPTPSQMMKSGATAILGASWNSTMCG